MPNLSDEGTRLVQDLAQRHGVSTDAATHMLIAVHNGNGSMAQFNHPEFGGSGQWMRGGMTMVSDLFNNQLKSRVDNICIDVSNSLANHQLVPFSGSFQSQSQGGSSSQSQAAGSISSANSLFVPDPTTNWWPSELGSPAAIGSQNNVRYAYFPASRRLAVTTGGDVWIYDTQDHQIGGFAQQQGLGGSITFTSQFGVVSLSKLPVVSKGGVPQPSAAAGEAGNESQAASPAEVNHSPTPEQAHTHQGNTAQSSAAESPSSQTPSSQSPSGSAAVPSSPADIIETLDRLGGLKEKGYISDAEFAAKKAELLSRL